MRHLSSRRHAGGFTLIELMIVVAIIGILAGIAYASYQFAVVKSRRATAASCLQQGAQFMERYYTTNMKYEGASAPTCDEVANFYSFDAETDTTTFTLTATPLNGQASADSKCGVLGINQAGERTITGTASSASECW
jgi:type IV pilus assembly protein PilE